MHVRLSTAQLKRKLDPHARERTIRLMERQRQLQGRLEAICNEKGLKVPEMIC